MTTEWEPKTVLLQGQPGSGKSSMLLTAIHQPVHVIDVDRKIRSSAVFDAARRDGRITSWELSEPLDSESLKARMNQLVATGDKAKAHRPPKGWTLFAEYMETMWSLPEVKAAGTIAIDSYTQLMEHLKSHIMYLVGRNKYTWDQWNAFLIGNRDIISVIRDLCKENHKDLIITVHERITEVVGDRVTGVIRKKDAEGNVTREYLGTQDVQIAVSVDGAFGQQMAGYFDEAYNLRVQVGADGKPQWICRVRPDGKRNLRTSFNVPTDEVSPPDFKKIWK